MSGYPGWREATLAQIGAAPTANKYRARKTTVEGQAFDSKHEARVWLELQAEHQAGRIKALQRQRVFPLIVLAKDGLPKLVGRYTADFVCHRDGQLEVIDAKSRATKTEAYQLRKKLFEALYGLVIVER
jgi:hypothetical protein